MSEKLIEAIKLHSALDVVNNSVLHGIQADIAFVRSVLPDHYTVQESKKRGSIHCKSEIGIRKDIDAEDPEHWSYILMAIKAHFAERFQEIFHHTCFCHVDFTIYLKERK